MKKEKKKKVKKKSENKNGSGCVGIRAFAAAIALVLERCTGEVEEWMTMQCTTEFSSSISLQAKGGRTIASLLAK